jgi:hypothetical protein
MQNSISVGISFPKRVIEKIDRERQDIPRSKYILRIIERIYLKNSEKNKNCNYPLDSSSLKPVSSESIIGGQ